MLNYDSILKPKLMQCRNYWFYNLEYLRTGTKIILKWILKKQYERALTALAQDRDR